MSTLSPAAQAVVDAVVDVQYALSGQESPRVTQKDRQILAAALRAAATQFRCDPNQSYQIGGITASRRQLLAIATELEAAG